MKSAGMLPSNIFPNIVGPEKRKPNISAVYMIPLNTKLWVPFTAGLTIICNAVLRIRIHRIYMFLGLADQDQDPIVRDMDPNPDPSITMQK
jgi:hypothetical protein